MEEKIKTTVNGKEVKDCEATVNDEAKTEEQSTTQPAVVPKPDGKLKKFGRMCWNNRGKIGFALGSAAVFLASCLLGKDDGGSDDEGPTE